MPDGINKNGDLRRKKSRNNHNFPKIINRILHTKYTHKDVCIFFIKKL